MNCYAQGGRQAPECLAIQERIGIDYYDDARDRAPSIAIPNRRQPFWRSVLIERVDGPA